MSRARLVDVAARAGVSRTTASAALSGGGRIGDETRRHVLAVAAEMGYSVNRQAQNLRTRRAGAIGVYLPPHATGYDYYLQFAFGVVGEAAQRQTPVVLVPHGSTEASLARDHVDGYVVIDASDEDDQLRRLLATGKPVVAAEPLPDDAPPAAGTVLFDHEHGTTDLLSHLAARGAQRVALVRPPLDTSWARQVNTAYHRWCAWSGSTPHAVTAPFLADAEGVEDPVLSLLSGPVTPDAIVVAQAGAAVAVATAVARSGRVVGQDVLLAACVDGAATRASTPPITALDLVPREHGLTCADLLLALLDGQECATTVTLRPQLRVRASTDPGPAASSS